MRRDTMEFERVLSYFDEDGDGKISPNELRSRMRKISGEFELKEAEIAIESLDSDGDGLLTLEDLIKLMVMESGGEDEKLKDFKEAFEMYDNEGCGFITPKSLKKMLKKLGDSKSIEECKLMIGRFDLNGDGVLSFQEFRIMME